MEAWLLNGFYEYMLGEPRLGDLRVAGHVDAFFTLVEFNCKGYYKRKQCNNSFFYYKLF